MELRSRELAEKAVQLDDEALVVLCQVVERLISAEVGDSTDPIQSFAAQDLAG